MRNIRHAINCVELQVTGFMNTAVTLVHKKILYSRIQRKNLLYLPKMSNIKNKYLTKVNL